MVTPTPGSRVTTLDPAMVYDPRSTVSDNNAGIVTGTPADWFGPQNPPKPSAPVEVQGRMLDFPSGYNLIIQPRAYESVKFDELRALADNWDILRLAIETRKDQMARLRWGFRPKMGLDGKPRAEPTDPRISALETFFLTPDREHSWPEWLRMLLEDLFVLDAPTLYKRRTYGGGLYALEPIDGATIKRVIDDWGRTPLAPAPAYQQKLHGLPAVNYTTQEMLYKPRNPRTSRVYGYSPVEQIIMTVNIALRREVFTLQYFTEGNVPEALVGVPDTWQPDQIKSFQEYFDSLMQSNLAARRRLMYVPAGVGKTFIETKQPELKGVFDEWLARVVCFAFSLSPQPFVSMMNRATADTAKEQSLEDGLGPVQDWVKAVVDSILVTDFGVTDLEFSWAEEDETDPFVQMQVITGYAKAGVWKIEEAREKSGMDPSGDPSANTLMVDTPTGYVPLDAFTQQQETAAANAKATADALASRPAPVAPGEAVPSSADDAESSGKDAKTKTEVGKAATVPFVRPGPVPYPRRLTRGAVSKMRRAWTVTLATWRTEAVSAVRDTLAKAEGDDVVDGMDMGGADDAGDASQESLASVASDSAQIGYAQIGSEDDVFDQANERAAKWATARSASLVTEVTDATRDAVRAAVSEGLAEGLTADEIADNVEALGVFSDARADLIAQTEIAAANSHGALDGYQAAADDTGLDVQKEWILGADPCDICQDNADDGPIALDDTFSSGDDAPPGHPRCECAVSPVVGGQAQ